MTQEFIDRWEANKHQVEMSNAAYSYTRDYMYRLRHIPTRYYLPPVPPEREGDLTILYEEMAKYGYIALDADGQPAVLSGKSPVLAHE